MSKKQTSIVIALLSAIIVALAVFLFMPTMVHIDYSDLSGHKEYDVTTSNWTVGSMLKNMDNLGITSQDKVKPSKNSRIKRGMTVKIVKATEKEADIGGRKISLVLYPVTVRENLELNGVSWGEGDIVRPSLDTMTDDYTNIVVIDKEVKTKDVTKTIRAGRKYVLDPNVDSGVVKEEKGKDGVQKYQYTTKYLNGKAGKTVKKLIEKQKPVETVNRLGTRDTGETGDVKIKNTFSAECSAYYSGENYKSSSGTISKFGTCAVDTTEIPLGTRLFVEGYGYALAVDTDNRLRGKQISLYMRSESEVSSWGNQTKKVYILETP